MAYGKELILDLYSCDISKFNRKSIKEWLEKLCVLIGMNREDLHFWDYEGIPEEEIPYDQPHLVGTSAVQFITTSDIVIHTVDMMKECYINIFSCREFDAQKAMDFTKDWFEAVSMNQQIIIRGAASKCKTNISEQDCIGCYLHGKCSGAKWTRQFCPNFKKEE